MARYTPPRSYVFVPEQSPLLMPNWQFSQTYGKPAMPPMNATDTFAESMPPAYWYKSPRGRRR